MDELTIIQRAPVLARYSSSVSSWLRGEHTLGAPRGPPPHLQSQVSRVAVETSLETLMVLIVPSDCLHVSFRSRR